MTFNKLSQKISDMTDDERKQTVVVYSRDADEIFHIEKLDFQIDENAFDEIRPVLVV